MKDETGIAIATVRTVISGVQHALDNGMPELARIALTSCTLSLGYLRSLTVEQVLAHHLPANEIFAALSKYEQVLRRVQKYESRLATKG